MIEGAGLSRLLPESLTVVRAASVDQSRWQQRKSLATRNAMLDAAIACLAECGYGGCSLQIVAVRAGISRGAMLHHYASKLDLMGAVIEYAFYRRMALFLDRINALTDEERRVRNMGVAMSYEITKTPEYLAYLELHMASRTDPELRAIFLERAALYDRVWREEIEAAFPEWAGDARLGMLNDFVWAMVDGLALNADTMANAARIDDVLQFVARIVVGIRTGALSI